MAFVSNLARDAGPTIAGFFYQVNMSILRWIDIGPSQRIELECGEDIDTVESDGEDGAEKRLLEQLKLRSGRSLTLRSVEALEALTNRCLHFERNPNTQLLFRYLRATNPERQRWRAHHAHPNFRRERARLSPADYAALVKFQLERSRQVLESRLGIKVDALAWPYGIYDHHLEEAARNAGYATGFAFDGGLARSGCDLYAIPRIPVSDSDTGERLSQLLTHPQPRGRIE